MRRCTICESEGAGRLCDDCRYALGYLDKHLTARQKQPVEELAVLLRQRREMLSLEMGHVVSFAAAAEAFVEDLQRISHPD